MRELATPAQVLSNPDSQEILRVWIAENRNVFIAYPGAFADPAAWGLLLVDLARHVAQGYSKDGKGDVDAMLVRIKQGFDAEWEVNTNTLDPFDP